MKTSDYLKCAILLLVFLFTACQSKPPIIGDAQCDNIAKNGYVSILVLNVDYEVVNYETNLNHIAHFVSTNHVDLILFQEAEAYGGITGPADATSELRKILLKKYKMRFNMTSAADIFIWGNAILSRCEITETDLKKINTPGTVGKGKGKMGLNRNVLLAVLSIPDYGKVNVYNTHLCARCEKSERAAQLDRALSWIKKTNPASRIAIFGGDFNFDLFINEGEEAFMWKKIIAKGFTDAYAHYFIESGTEQLKTLCEDEDDPDLHCTKGVTRIDDKNGRRVDYIFIRSFASIKNAEVVFNSVVRHTEPTVSDHAGVLIRLNLH